MVALSCIIATVHDAVREQHNQIESVGHMALVLTYAVTLVLRNLDDDEAFAGELFPREGYGWFIVFIYVFCLPAPTIYALCTYDKTNDKEGDLTALVDNPLVDSQDDWEFDSERTPSSDPISLPRIARMQREHKEVRSENEALRSEITALRAQSSVLETSGDGSGKENTAPTYVPPTPIEKDPAKLEITALQAIQDDESLAEEIRASARQNIAELTAARLLESKAVIEGLSRSARQKKSAVATAWKAPERQREEFRTWLGDNRSVLPSPPGHALALQLLLPPAPPPPLLLALPLRVHICSNSAYHYFTLWWLISKYCSPTSGGQRP